MTLILHVQNWMSALSLKPRKSADFAIEYLRENEKKFTKLF